MRIHPINLFSILILVLLGSISCRPMDYFLLHPLEPQPGVFRESEIFDRGQLRVHWVAYYRDQKNPLPAVLVHPDAGGLAEDMEGICLALAEAGYFAAAVHYQRLENPGNKNPLFPWKSPEDVTAAVLHLKEHPRVDSNWIGLLGFSKGGVLSLLIASQDPGVKAVVAYYPLADFEEWFDVKKYSFPQSLWIRGARSYFMRELRASTWEEASKMLRVASPIHQVTRIRSPVLLIHGEKDHTAPLGQVQHLCQEFRPPEQKCELFVVPGAGHVFNFLDEIQGKVAWDKTLDFFNEYPKGNAPR